MLTHLALVGAAVLGPGPTPDPQIIEALRLTAAQGAPAIDGSLQDAVWSLSDSISGFVQVEPNPGEAARFQTVARVVFDNEAVYVGVRAFDPKPGAIMAQLTRRDEESASDWIQIAFDSRYDRRTAYVFGVNPAGVKLDGILTDDSNMDHGWNAVWEVAAGTDEMGWTAEFRIPLAMLRFDTDGEGVWGFQVVREVQRVQETSAWAPFRDDEPRIVSRFGELHGMTGLEAPRRLEVLPYTVSSVARVPGDPENPFFSPTRWEADAGVDVKYGVTSDLTLDLTVNPDFGQVEADPSEVNLSAFESFFSERRPFFTEGADIFRFDLSAGDDDTERLFYSRCIGRPPQGEADARGGFVNAPEETTILGAAKLSGRVGGGWTVGLLHALTAEERAHVRGADGSSYTDVIEPLTNYSVARVRRDMNEGRTQVGAIATGVLRRLDGTGLTGLRRAAVAGGVDFSHRFAGDGWLFNGSLLQSYVEGSDDAILRAQTSSARYFQRPDADHVSIDSVATTLSGTAASAEILKISGRWRGGAITMLRSPGFEINDIGFQFDADYILAAGFVGYRQLSANRTFRTSSLNLNAWTVRNFAADNIGLGGNVNGYAQLDNFWEVYAGINHDLEELETGALRGGPAMRAPASTNGWFGVGSDGRKRLSAGFEANWRYERESGGRRFGLYLDSEWRPTSSTQVAIAPFYNVERNGWQYVSQPADSLRNTHYLFADLDQRTFGLSARVDQTFTPDLSLQFWAQPFVSAGRYSDFREVADPRAERFADRFQPISGGIEAPNPNFNVRDFKLNAVLRWEYRLGSTLFFVWSHGRSSSDDHGRFRPADEMDALFRAPSRNVFLIKANWWLNL